MVNFRTYELATVYFKECQKVRVAAFLRNQLDRAASSIVLNLAEGNGRQTTNDRKHFFQIAYGSLKETQAIYHLFCPPEAEVSYLRASQLRKPARAVFSDKILTPVARHLHWPAREEQHASRGNTSTEARQFVF